MHPKLFVPIQQFCEQLTQDFDSIPSERKAQLSQLSQYFLQKYQQGIPARAIVICTHNSRRSHLGQLWLAMACDYYGIPMMGTYSGGTEATAFNPRAVAALLRAGLQIRPKEAAATNPIYQIWWTEDMAPYLAFSKKFDHPDNPNDNFAAIMVCTEADQGCPFVPGTDFRFSLPYDDPKTFDGTDLESDKYDERCRQIGREMMYILSLVKAQLN